MRRDASRGGTGSGRANHKIVANKNSLAQGIALGVHVGFITMSATTYITQGLSFLPYLFTSWWMSVNSPSGAAAGC